MTIEHIVASLILVIQLTGVFFYIRSMALGSTRPNRVTWFIWALAPLIATGFAIKAGAGISILPVFMAGFNPILVLIASFLIQNGYWKINRLDIVCGALAIFSLLLWIITHSYSIAIIFAIMSDALAGIPTIIKSWKYPDTETASAYMGGIIANILGLFIVTNWTFPVYISGFYFIALNLILVFSIYRKKIIFWYTS